MTTQEQRPEGDVEKVGEQVMPAGLDCPDEWGSLCLRNGGEAGDAGAQGAEGDGQEYGR